MLLRPIALVRSNKPDGIGGKKDDLLKINYGIDAVQLIATYPMAWVVLCPKCWCKCSNWIHWAAGEWSLKIEISIYSIRLSDHTAIKKTFKQQIIFPIPKRIRKLTKIIERRQMAKPNFSGTESWCLLLRWSQTPQHRDIKTIVDIYSRMNASMSLTSSCGAVWQKPDDPLLWASTLDGVRACKHR